MATRWRASAGTPVFALGHGQHCGVHAPSARRCAAAPTSNTRVHTRARWHTRRPVPRQVCMRPCARAHQPGLAVPTARARTRAPSLPSSPSTESSIFEEGIRGAVRDFQLKEMQAQRQEATCPLTEPLESSGTGGGAPGGPQEPRKRPCPAELAPPPSPSTGSCA